MKKTISKSDDVIWVHVASLGEFEQGLPIIEKLRTEYSSYKILVTFFSPSGYEVKKNTNMADVVTYLPMDTRENATLFLEIARPKLAIFIKYEIWPNYLKLLHERQIPTFLVSAIFKKNQIYFKSYGQFMRKALRQFDHYFVQDNRSKELLESISIKNISVSGDTRFDRVSNILTRNNSLAFMDDFKKDCLCLVAGSTWPEDETILVDYINSSSETLKYVLAPHNINPDQIKSLKNSISKNALLYSEIEEKNLTDYDVLIVDTIGLLTKIYSYADMAYVGGGFHSGLHNTLEPAAFGIPILIGPNYFGFKEAEDLVLKNGILVVQSKVDFTTTLNRLLIEALYREKTGKINGDFVMENTGASIQIMGYIRKLL